MKLYNFCRRDRQDSFKNLIDQSVLQEMFKDAMAKKPDLNVLPTLEEQVNNSYNFHLNMSKQKGKNSWKYSEALNKLYIKVNEIVNIDAIFDFQLPVQEYRIRAFLSFTQNVSEPVLRCQNHISKDAEKNSVKRESVMRCENPIYEHCGTADGKSIKDRFSIVVPVSVGVMPNGKNIKQTIVLKFTCQNSCFGRKETCIVFVLEGMSGEILAQRILNVRICSCPKRDKSIDEKNSGGIKRKAEDHPSHLYCKIQKAEPISPELSPVVKEKEDSSCSSDNEAEYDLQRTASGRYRLVMDLTNKELAQSVIDYALSKECTNAFSGSKDLARSQRAYQRLKRLYNEIQ